MKLLFLIDNLGSGGAQRQLATIAPLLKQRGIEVEVLCYSKNDFFATSLMKNNIPIHWITPKSYLTRIWKIRHFIRREKYDGVISFLDTPDLLNCISAIGGHTWKVITSERSANEAVFRTTRGKIIAWVKKYSDSIVCNSENSRQMWLKYYPNYLNKLKVIYNLVILPEIDFTYVPRKGGKMNIVVAASYQYLKNPINVIKAINLLSNEEKSVLRLSWYGNTEVKSGNTEAYDQSVALINRYNLSEIILLHKATNNIVDLMNQADVVGLFSQLEGLPNAICEAMYLKKPVIMTKVSDYKLLVDQNNGVLCAWDNINSITDAFREIINWNSKEIAKRGENSKFKSEKLFGEKKIINQWLNILEYEKDDKE